LRTKDGECAVARGKTVAGDPRESATDGGRDSRRVAIAVTVIAAALVVAGASGYLRWRAYQRSPRAAIAIVAHAAADRDVPSVLAHIDATAVADSAVEELLRMPDNAAVARYLEQHPNVSVEGHKQQALSLLVGEIQEHVSDGTLPTRIPLGTDSMKGVAASAFAASAVSSERVYGRIARVTVEIPLGRQVVPIDLVMRRSGDTWVIVQVANLHSLITKPGY
jgi:hypothetical protein